MNISCKFVIFENRKVCASNEFAEDFGTYNAHNNEYLDKCKAKRQREQGREGENFVAKVFPHHCHRTGIMSTKKSLRRASNRMHPNKIAAFIKIENWTDANAQFTQTANFNNNCWYYKISIKCYVCNSSHLSFLLLFYTYWNEITKKLSQPFTLLLLAKTQFQFHNHLISHILWNFWSVRNSH